MKYKPDFILIDALVEHLPITQQIVEKFRSSEVTIIDDVQAIKKPSDFSEAKKTMVITSHRGEAFKPCQGVGEGHLCCNYWIIDLISNCPMDCSYCILQSYLQNNPYLTIYTNIDEILTKASFYFAQHKDRNFRVGTGELSDSLALDHVTGFSKKLIEYFSRQKHVMLELKTKTTNIDHLLKIKGNENTVISWSVNPQKIIDTEEIGTAPLGERFAAASRAIAAGYKVGFHFDPIVFSEDWEEGYKNVVGEIVETMPHEKIAWISLGTLRFPHDLKEIALKRFPRSKIFFQELVPVNGKVRYFRPIRESVYSKMLEWLKPLKGTVPVYFCMETRQVWNNLLPHRFPVDFHRQFVFV